MKTIFSFFILLGTILLFSCFNAKNIDSQKPIEKNSVSVCNQYRLSIKLYDVRNKDTVLSNSWNPGYNGWDVGFPIPDSILIVVSIETSPLDFANNKPFDINVDLNLQLKGSQTWDCMNSENPVFSPRKIVLEKKKVFVSDFFSGEQTFENLRPAVFSCVINLKAFLKETSKYYREKGQIFILNALIIEAQVTDTENASNTCTIEHYHPICLESTKTIFDSEN